MTLLEAYDLAVNEDDDPKERAELSADKKLKQCMVDEIVDSMKEIRDNKTPSSTAADMVLPLFRCVAFWFIMGIRVGKILRDEELASGLNKQ